jgi:hypothetical protein
MATPKSTSAKTGTRKQPATRKSSKGKKKITADDIRRKAAEIYHQRMQHGHQGDELSDWLKAEKELNNLK